MFGGREVKRKGGGMWVGGKKRKEKRKMEKKRSGTWVVGKKGKKKKEGGGIQRKQRERMRKMGKEGILGVVKKKKNFRGNNKK